ncbi:hypothetical protein ACQKWADRAFT_284545 [Trichoderma austrokoningii]
MPELAFTCTNSKGRGGGFLPDSCSPFVLFFSLFALLSLCLDGFIFFSCHAGGISLFFSLTLPLHFPCFPFSSFFFFPSLAIHHLD